MQLTMANFNGYIRQMEARNIITILKKSALFDNVDIETLASISRSASVCEFPKGRVLFLHGEQAQFLYIVISGRLKLFRETFDGAEAVLNVVDSHKVMGSDNVMMNSNYRYSAETIEDCRLLRLPLSILREELQKNHAMALSMLSYMTRKQQRLDQELEQRSLQNASQRIGCFFMRQDFVKEGGNVVIKLPYDKTLVASRLGMQPETFSRALGKLKTEAGLVVKGGKITVPDIQKLADYVCVACCSEVPCCSDTQKQ